MKLSDTQMQILNAAAQHPHGLAEPPERLPTAARQTVGKALLKNDLVIAVHRPDYDARALWAIDGESLLLRITDAGRRAIGIEPDSTAVDAAERGGLTQAEYQEEQALAQEALDAGLDLRAHADAEEDSRPRHEQLGVDEDLIYGPAEEWQQPTGDEALLDLALAEGTPRGLKAAAQAVLSVWDSVAARGFDGLPTGEADGMAQAIERLRAALADKPIRALRQPGTPRKPREGTKQEQVLTLLRRSEGATVAQIAEATGWAPHTVRGFFAGLKKRQGIEVQVLERVRMVGPNKEGAKGSYTIYHLPA